MDKSTILAISSLVAKTNQIVVPREVRKHLNLQKGDKIYWIKTKDEKVFGVFDIEIDY